MERFDSNIHRCPFSVLCSTSLIALLVFIAALMVFA
jgi:hypothetical protein